MKHTDHTHDRPARDFGPDAQSPNGFRRRRPFDYGALRLIVLSMIVERPRHGYELMKAIEERMGGGYSPSPGVIYPTLAWLEDMGFAGVESDGGRKSYRITADGESFLAANREQLAAIAGRMGEAGRRRNAPDAVLDAMHELKRALRSRFIGGEVEQDEIDRIAAALKAVTRAVDAGQDTAAAAAANTGADAAGAPVRSRATVTTPKAAHYAAQLCKHFSHKVEAHFADGRGDIAFPFGAARLAVEDDRLTMTAEAADAAALGRIEEVLASHLLRFAFREELHLEWQPA